MHALRMPALTHYICVHRYTNPHDSEHDGGDFLPAMHLVCPAKGLQYLLQSVWGRIMRRISSNDPLLVHDAGGERRHHQQQQAGADRAVHHDRLALDVGVGDRPEEQHRRRRPLHHEDGADADA